MILIGFRDGLVIGNHGGFVAPFPDGKVFPCLCLREPDNSSMGAPDSSKVLSSNRSALNAALSADCLECLKYMLRYILREKTSVEPFSAPLLWLAYLRLFSKSCMRRTETPWVDGSNGHTLLKSSSAPRCLSISGLIHLMLVLARVMKSKPARAAPRSSARNNSHCQ